MAHHFDIEATKDDPSLNVCDLYLFPGSPGLTTMVMTTNADVGVSSPDLLHKEGLYAFRFDLDGDGREDLVLTFRFGEPRHARGDAHAHVQDFVVRQSQGPGSGTGGRTLIEGRTGEIARSGDVSAFVGVVPEAWAADGAAFQAALKLLGEEHRFDQTVFLRRENLFRNRNVMALVLEVPDSMFAVETVRSWATISLFGHAPEVQIYRFGFPLFTHLFLSSAPGAAERYHVTTPNEDRVHFAPFVSAFVERLSRAAGRVPDPAAYGARIANLLCPSMMRYGIGAPSTFSVGNMNGRALSADAYDTMWSLAAGRPVADGVTPPVERLADHFPYYGKPFGAWEQEGLVPLRTLIGYGPDARNLGT